MLNPPYEYNRVKPYRYTFESRGKRTIIKVVEFSSAKLSNVYNLAFGDLLPNDEIDDKANSNNGDIIKIFATVIDILPGEIPHLKLCFWEVHLCELYYISAS